LVEESWADLSVTARAAHAELVALRVCQHNPWLDALTDVSVRRSMGHKAGDLNVLVGAEVQMQPSGT
jgi:hypothetical protein